MLRATSKYWHRNHGELLLIGLLLLACLACFFIAHRTTSPGMVPPTRSWALPYQSSVKNIPHKLAHRPSWWRYPFNWGLFFLMKLACIKLTKENRAAQLRWWIRTLQVNWMEGTVSSKNKNTTLKIMIRIWLEFMEQKNAPKFWVQFIFPIYVFFTEERILCRPERRYENYVDRWAFLWCGRTVC